jgi:type III restriction enzyme
MILKNFQEKAVDNLILRSFDLLNKTSNKKIIFKSPTGSGKTLMVAEYLKRFVQEKISKKPSTFIWTTPRKTLTQQSRSKLEKHYSKDRILKCTYFSELNKNNISENEILFLNWESINKIDKNTIILENEREFYLSKVIENTKEKGREIILIIDESHHHATSEISRKLIKDISPKLAIEVSATPVMGGADDMVTVDFDEVKSAGLVKKSVILNENFQNIFSKNKIKSKLSESSEKIVLDKAIEKRFELVKLFKKNKSTVNPLILIQLPDKKTEQEDRIKIETLKYLKDKYKITTENGKLAIYLSENKKNFENISKINNEVEVLIFKQGIALGWDCPRAQILVLYRDWRSITFSIQTVGRIMRMPETLKKEGHYYQEKLNHAYIFTNLETIELKEDQAKDYFRIFNSKSTKNIKLTSYSRVRQREKTRLNPLFVKLFLKEAEKYKLNKVIKSKNQSGKFLLIVNKKSDSVDSLIGKKFSGKKINILNDTDLQRIFDFFIRSNLSPFYPEDRSVGKVKEALYSFFAIHLKLNFEKSFREIINIILSEDNITKFKDVIDLAKNRYMRETQKRDDVIKSDSNWNFPKDISFTGNFYEMKVKKSVMKPFLYDYKWKPEENFIKFLEKSKKVEWWFKNGDRDETYFSIPYEENNQTNLFYIDFIVKHKSGKIFLFDTKSGWTIDKSKNKSDGLQKYIRKNSKKIQGGLVTNTNKNDFSGRWIFYKKKGFDLDSNNLDNWENLLF